MARAIVTADNTAEATTLAECLAKFGPDVLDALVTNWIQGHADAFKERRVSDIVKAAALDPTVKASVDTLAAQAATVLTAKAAADKDDPTDATGVIS